MQNSLFNGTEWLQNIRGWTTPSRLSFFFDSRVMEAGHHPIFLGDNTPTMKQRLLRFEMSETLQAAFSFP